MHWMSHPSNFRCSDLFSTFNTKNIRVNSMICFQNDFYDVLQDLDYIVVHIKSENREMCIHMLIIHDFNLGKMHNEQSQEEDRLIDVAFITS